MSDEKAGLAPAQGLPNLPDLPGLQPRGARLNRALAGDTGPWLGALAGLWAAGGSAAATGMLGAPTGFGTPVDLVMALSAHTAAFGICALLAAWALTFIPRIAGPLGTVGGLLYTGALVFFLLFFSDMGVSVSLLLACAYTLAAGAAGGLIAAACSRRTSRRLRTASLLALALCGIAGIWAAGPSIPVPDWPRHASDDDAGPAAVDADADGGLAPHDARAASYRPFTAGDPAEPGRYAFDAFTYGSGADRRPEFGKDARLLSQPADASAYLKDLPLLRKWYWGFGAKALPLNGRVWMPRGDGPFPLVLIVHGNHAMEDYSDAGYAYLGEQLASRGFLTVSVDENFLNYSVWSGIPDRDMLLRAWILLRHIGQLREFADDPDSPLYGKADLRNISLVGHSRGGQAVAMAADRDEWFAEDGTLPAQSDYRIVSVAAIAPTDTVVDGKQARLRGISYLTLQGASDADINDFFGDRQYARTTFAASGSGQADAAFKASLYIEGANHGQFNASWGQRDSSLPAGLFLRKPPLAGEAQRRIAKGYLTAFMEATLRGDAAYRPLFEDYRAASPYLPNTQYVSRYEGDAFRAWTRFDEEGAGAANPGAGLTGDAQAVSAGVEEAQDRQRHGKGTQGLVLQWASEGKYAMTWDRAAATGASAENPTVLSFALADLSRDLPGWDGDSAAGGIRIGLSDARGVYAELPLSDFASPKPLFRASVTRLGRLEPLVDDGKYKEAYEPVFQTYRLPLDAWSRANPSFDPGAIKRIVFVMDGGPGKVMVDDVGAGPANR
ncbi:alpha/beta hydrolase family protein [Cohnella sp. JJ-181]|uniref:alpha/beta hydrolase family protein n=1 Tax=Cohnella rhizoplanae TaxID=2974897 RepID=UPI0022FF789D|nr:alpha/beta hydrolase [Cohnella sp. JJ-181]CAI6081620.1 hypothetical protein COHCIP112018_03371 [Cohnella sp. JJ-181]